MRVRHSLVILFLVSFCAVAEPSSPTKIEIATRLAELLDVKSQWANSEKECSRQFGPSLDPDKLYAAGPGTFGGITPKSAYWPRIREIFRQYQAAICGELQADKVSPIAAAEFMDQMTEAELLSTVKFLQSPTGAKFRKANAAAMETARRTLTQRVGVDSAGYVATQKALSDVVNEYLRSPR